MQKAISSNTFWESNFQFFYALEIIVEIENMLQRFSSFSSYKAPWVYIILENTFE